MWPVETVLATGVLLVLMLLALTALGRGWVRSSSIGGYRANHGTDGIEEGPKVPEDDDAHWHWSDRRTPR